MEKKKRLAYPTWKYKSRIGYLKAKQKQLEKAYNALLKVRQGSAWMPKKVRDRIDVMLDVYFELLYTELSGFIKRLKRHKSK